MSQAHEPITQERLLHSGAIARARSLADRAALMQVAGDLAQAIDLQGQALAIIAAQIPADPLAASMLTSLGRMHEALGDPTGAFAHHRQALGILRAALGEDHPDTATCMSNIGYVLLALGDPGATRPYYEQALAIRMRALGPAHTDTGLSLYQMGCLLQTLGDLDGALTHCAQALRICAAGLGDGHPATQMIRMTIASLDSMAGTAAAPQPAPERTRAAT